MLKKSKPNRVHVIPTKRGLWRVCQMTPEREARWQRAWEEWFARVGCRLAISPEMWMGETTCDGGANEDEQDAGPFADDDDPNAGEEWKNR